MAIDAPSNSTTEYKSRIVADYILAQFRLLRDGEQAEKRPLMISMQGPQGAGEFHDVAFDAEDLTIQARARCQRL
jgi:pantothenate kinase-related protein Tda10